MSGLRFAHWIALERVARLAKDGPLTPVAPLASHDGGCPGRTMRAACHGLRLAGEEGRENPLSIDFAGNRYVSLFIPAPLYRVDT